MVDKKTVRDELMRQLFAAQKATALEKKVVGKTFDKAFEKHQEKKQKFQAALAGLVRNCRSCGVKSSQAVVKTTRCGELCRECAQEQGVLEEFMEEAFQPIKEPTEKPKSFGEWS